MNQIGPAVRTQPRRRAEARSLAPPPPCRCVVLSDPLKDSSRSQESWNSLLLKLRTLLLMSFTKNLGRFEDDMRTLREKRTQPGWSFCEYFMVQVNWMNYTGPF